MPNELLTDRERRLLDAVLILGAIALGFVVVNFASGVFTAFGDILLLFFLAWLLSFALLPLITAVSRVPKVPQAGAVILVYLAIVGVVLGVIVQVSASLVTSISQFLRDAPTFEAQLTSMLADLQDRLAALGLSVDLAAQAPQIVANVQSFAGSLIQPLQSVAVASIGVFGNILILVILSIYIALDRDEIAAFLYRLVPPAYVPQARVLQSSVGRSFGGFLRGQVLIGVVFALFTAAVNLVFGLQYASLTTVAAGLLQMIPFFGPFISWAPPVLVAMLTPGGPVLPVLILMAIAWFVTMNLIQPPLMAGSVGIHPIVVLGSVVIGLRVAGIAGAIFGIPIAAVISALFFHWVARSREHGTVADRATRRVARREGRVVRRPREPVPGVDEDVAEVAGDASTPAQSADGMPPDPGRTAAPGPTAGLAEDPASSGRPQPAGDA